MAGGRVDVRAIKSKRALTLSDHNSESRPTSGFLRRIGHASCDRVGVTSELEEACKRPGQGEDPGFVSLEHKMGTAFGVDQERLNAGDGERRSPSVT